MTIRWKVGLLITALLAVLGLSELLVADRVLMPSFTRLERGEADKALRRVRSALDRTLDQMALSAISWGNWADTYRFAKDHNRAFIDENLTVIGLRDLAVDALLVMDANGRELASATLGMEAGRAADPKVLRSMIVPASSPHTARLPASKPMHGILNTPDGLVLVASSPILDGFGRGPARGTVVMGRYLSKAEADRLAVHTQVALSILPPMDRTTFKPIVESDNNISAFETLTDIHGQPALTLRVDLPRGITRSGWSAVRYATSYLLVTSVIVVILLMLILDRVVLNPLARVTRHAVTIAKDGDMTQRLNFARADELGVLADEIDRMVARMAESRSQLVDQSFQAGFAELSKGVLHNLGNAMTPIGVRLATLEGRLRSVDEQDFLLVAAEIGSAELDTERRMSLAELLDLASGSLEDMLRQARNDVELIIRQTSVVQSALAEQLRSTRNEHVWEAVRLPDLLAQSLEIVPDSARSRLLIQADEQVENLGVVNVPRTVLRLVLQNLIINAAEAIEAAGRAPGELRVGARIEMRGADELLVLHCTDNGVGIPAERLERVFEKGFSTKSRETNCGIGLHWCANVLAALGGCVWATSEGAGRGATFHVSLPLRSPAQRVSEAA
ncbi:MAG: HAMP domain-containing protein [Proteobacteria bacterium]|nr:HAMP domain-containing protein [Pseudomonadota bacterium]